MHILLTGGFGNIGHFVVQEIIQKGYQLTIYDLPTAKNKKLARNLKHEIRLIWGDISIEEKFSSYLKDIDVIIHLAAIIPPNSERNAKKMYQVNVEGTKKILDAINLLAQPPKLIFTSSLTVYGYTQNRDPPRRVGEPLNPPDQYSNSKVQCEHLIKNSNITWTILRLAASTPVEIQKFDPIMFEIPLSTRIEFVHPHDVARAIVNAINNNKIWGKTVMIGGGTSCQLRYRDYVSRILDAYGVGMLPDEAFGQNPYYTDWLYTEDSQKILQYQCTSFEDYAKEIDALVGWRRPLVMLIRPIARYFVLKKSPYYKKNKTKEKT